MKKIILFSIFCFLLLTVLLKAQTPPNAFNYSAVARNPAGQPIATTTIGIQITILKTSPIGASQYSENHFVNTDAYGLFNLVIGAGAVQSGSIAAIDWSNDNYYLKVGMDANGGTNFLTMGTTQLLSVPYALYAKSAGSITGGSLNETDPIYTASVANGITTADTVNWNNKQSQLTAGTGINISGNTISTTLTGGFTHFIGEQFGGGVIFHLWKDNLGVEHGLIVSLTDQSTGNQWSNVISPVIGVNAQSSWNGLSNSNAIVSQNGHTNSAAKLCLDLVSGGQSDWYLPSIDELSLLWHNRFNVNKALSTIGGASILHFFDGYWSSTEYYNNDNVFQFSFQTGYPFLSAKGVAYYVRAIRTF